MGKIGVSALETDMAGTPNRIQNHLMITSTAARVLGLSEDGVRWPARGERLPAQRTTNGVRWFRRGDVERLAAERVRRAVVDKRRTAPQADGASPRSRRARSGQGNP